MAHEGEPLVNRLDMSIENQQAQIQAGALTEEQGIHVDGVQADGSQEDAECVKIDGDGVGRRCSITGEMKREICDLKMRSEAMSQDMIVTEMARRHGVRLSRTTVCKILKETDKWMNITDAEARQKRQRQGKYPDLEDELIDWFKEVRACEAMRTFY